MAMCCRVISTFRFTFSTHTIIATSHHDLKASTVYRAETTLPVIDLPTCFRRCKTACFCSWAYSTATKLCLLLPVPLSEKRSSWNCIIGIEHFSSSYILSHILFHVGAWVMRKRVSHQGILMLRLQSAIYRYRKYIITTSVYRTDTELAACRRIV